MTPLRAAARAQTRNSPTIENRSAPGPLQSSALVLRDLRFMKLTVVYGCSRTGPGAEERLAAGLLDRLARIDGKCRSRARWRDLSVLRSPLGQPLVVVDGEVGPAISLSRASGLLWGAVSQGPDVGIDVVLRDEFAGPYPYHRAFGSEELALVTDCIGHDLPLAAAGIWAMKEAAVKAVGIGFHGIDPRDVRVLSVQRGAGGECVFQVRVGLTCPVWLSREGAGWLALALAPSDKEP